MQTGKLYLIPNTLGSNEIGWTIPAEVSSIINKIDNYVVENVKTAVQFLKAAGLQKKPNELTFRVLNKDTDPKAVSEYLGPALAGEDIGLLSEAGVPCIADPGAVIVSLAHEMGIKVVPLTGPSSIILALMASGLNGQNFTFNGYLPIDSAPRSRRLLELQKKIETDNTTQIFIEAPHRNDTLLAAILDTCKNTIKLCIAVDITLATEYICTKAVGDWKRNVPPIGKHPAIFILGK
jgi:16S rRNA (cytidine1402-2'-O)-methyltransferase